MPVDPVSSGYTPVPTPTTAAQTAAQRDANKASDSLDKNGFLKMLTEQIKNQDPSSSQDPTQYFQTISAMTEVEQLLNLAGDSSKQNATSMIGKTVSYLLPDGTTSSGVVNGVDFSNSDTGPLLAVGDSGVAAADSIITVSQTPAPAPAPAPTPAP